MKTNEKGIALIKRFEGTGPMVNGLCQPYKCSAGYWTIGYGNRWIGNIPVTGSTTPITLAMAEMVMTQHIESMEPNIDLIMTNTSLSSNQYSAIASWVYNLGCERLRSSTLLKKLNANDLVGASKEILVWNKETVNGKLQVSTGLDNRRKAEYALFCTP
jgi:lysozyme